MAQDVFDTIKQEIGKLGKKVARGVVQQALKDMQHAHEAIVTNYYDAYTPVKCYTYISPKTNMPVKTHGYRRTNNFRNNSLESLTISHDGTQAKMIISSNNMHDYVNPLYKNYPPGQQKTFPAERVFDFIWNYGNRGLPPGYRGHVELFTIGVGFSGISMEGTPDNAMYNFMDQWWEAVGSNKADEIWNSSI